MNFPNPTFSVDLVILAVVIVTILTGLLLGQERVKTFALSVYAGIVIASELGPVLHKWVQSQNILGGTLGTTSVKLILFALPILILEFGRRKHLKAGRSGFIMKLVLSILTAALLISSALSLFDPIALKRILAESSLAWPIYNFRLWWIALVPVAVLGESFIRSREPH